MSASSSHTHTKVDTGLITVVKEQRCGGNPSVAPSGILPSSNKTQTAGGFTADFLSQGHKHTHTPVVEVHDSLDGAAPSGVDVSFKPWQQRSHHVHSVFFALPERDREILMMKDMKELDLRWVSCYMKH